MTQVELWTVCHCKIENCGIENKNAVPSHHVLQAFSRKAWGGEAEKLYIAHHVLDALYTPINAEHINAMTSAGAMSPAELHV